MRSITRHAPVGLLAAALLMTACAGGMAGARGMYDWDAGTAVTYEIVTLQTTSIEVPGAGEQVVGATSSTTMEVVATGTRTFDITFTDASVVSDQADPTGMVPEVTELIGTKASVTLNARGLIVESSGLEQNPFVQFIGTDAFMDQTLQVLFQVLPEGDLVEGAEWGREYAYPFGIMGLELEMSNSESFRCLEYGIREGRPAFRIGNEGESRLVGGGYMQGAEMDMMLAGSGSGSTWIVADSGQVLSSELNIKMNGGITAGGMDIPMGMEMKVTLTIKDRE